MSFCSSFEKGSLVERPVEPPVESVCSEPIELVLLEDVDHEKNESTGEVNELVEGEDIS